VDRFVRKTLISTQLDAEALGLRSAIHRDLIFARYSCGSTSVQIVETGVGVKMFIRDPSNPLDPARTEELLATVKSQIVRFCNISAADISQARAHHGFRSNGMTYGGQLAIACDGLPELQIAWWNRPRFIVLGDVLMISFSERLGNEPSDRGGAGAPVPIPRAPRSPGRFG